jgi:hypothetical protein
MMEKPGNLTKLGLNYLLAVMNVDVTIEELKCLKQSVGAGIVERFAATDQLSYSGRGPRKQLLKIFSKEEYVIASVLDPRVKLRPYTSNSSNA